MTIQVVNCWLFATAATDPYFSSTVLLLSCEGADASDTFTDLSAAARGNANVNDDAAVDTALSKFGSGSLRLDGNDDDINYSDSADWQMTGDFTMEGWFAFDASNIGATTQALIAQYETGSQRSFILQLTSTGLLQFAISTNGTGGAGSPFPLSASWEPDPDTFYHIAVDRSANAWRLYVNGAMLASLTSSSTPFNSNTRLRIGKSLRLDGLAGTNFMHGNVNWVRITKGVARYASDAGYSVPTAPFPTS